MPKSSLLHLHSDVCATAEWFFKTIKKYSNNIYIKTDNKFLYYFDAVPNDGDYELLCEVRQKSGDVKKFDDDLLKKLFMVPEDQELDANTLWIKFIVSLISIFGVVLHEKIYPEYMLELINNCVDEGLQHVCIRLISKSIKNDKKEGIDDFRVVEMIKDAV